MSLGVEAARSRAPRLQVDALIPWSSEQLNPKKSEQRSGTEEQVRIDFAALRAGITAFVCQTQRPKNSLAPSETAEAQRLAENMRKDIQHVQTLRRRFAPAAIP